MKRRGLIAAALLALLGGTAARAGWFMWSNGGPDWANAPNDCVSWYHAASEPVCWPSNANDDANFLASGPAFSSCTLNFDQFSNDTVTIRNLLIEGTLDFEGDVSTAKLVCASLVIDTPTSAVEVTVTQAEISVP